MKKKIALLMAVVMLFGVVAGGTLAWLQADTTVVENTFVAGDIDIDLTETDVDEDDDESDNITINDVVRDKANEYKIIPGNKYFKDPLVTVEAGSEECWIFVEVIESNNNITVNGVNQKVINFEINNTEWTKLNNTGDRNIYYYNTTVNALNETEDILMDSSVLKIYEITDGDWSIIINPSVTKDTMDAAATAKLEFKAYAVQRANLDTATIAWTSTFGA